MKRGSMATVKDVSEGKITLLLDSGWMVCYYPHLPHEMCAECPE